MSDILQFADRQQFRDWLQVNCRLSAGVWLILGKSGGPETIKGERGARRGALLRLDRRTDAKHR